MRASQGAEAPAARIVQRPMRDVVVPLSALWDRPVCLNNSDAAASPAHPLLKHDRPGIFFRRDLAYRERRELIVRFCRLDLLQRAVAERFVDRQEEPQWFDVVLRRMSKS